MEMVVITDQPKTVSVGLVIALIIDNREEGGIGNACMVTHARHGTPSSLFNTTMAFIALYSLVYDSN